MSAAKHTPGPWKAHFGEAYYVTGPDLGRVAVMMNLKGAHGMGGRRSGDESAANCRLIAAAPTTAEKAMAFTLLVERFVRGPEVDAQPVSESELADAMYELRAHIAKATGSAE